MIDERGRIEAELLHAEARRVADTQQALRDVLAGVPSVPVQDRRPERHSPQRWLLGVAAAVALAVVAVTVAVVRPDPSDVPPTGTPTSASPASSATSPGTTDAPNRTPAASPLLGDVFVTTTGRRALIDVRDAAGVVATFDLGCSPDRECVIRTARVMADTIWVAIGDHEPGQPDVVLGSRVVSVERSTGDVVEHLALVGSATVGSAGLGADGTLYAYVVEANTYDRHLVAVEQGGTRTLASGVAGFRLSDDGRLLAVSYSDPPAGEPARFEITNLVDGTTAGFETQYTNAGPATWSPDGRYLIVAEQWEDGTAWVVDPWAGSGAPIAGTEDFLDGGCFMSNTVVAHRTWNVGYGQGDAQVGVIRLTDLTSGATVTDLGENLFGDGLRCHADGSVTFLRRAVVEVERAPGFTQLEPDYDAPVELVHLAPDGSTTVRDTGVLRMV